MLQTQFFPARQAGSRRLLLMLHGLGDSVAGYQWLPEALRLPEMNYLLANAPDDYFGGFSWYDYEGEMVPGVCRSRELLFQLLDKTRADGFPTEQTTLGGFSQGCLMAMEVGCRYPHRFAGVVGISGYLCQPEVLVQELSPAARLQRFLVTHGTWDPLLPLSMAREHFQQLRNAGLDLTWREFGKEHTIIEDELQVIRDFIVAGYAPGGG